TLWACAEKTAKLVPVPSKVAPSGYGRPGRMTEACAEACAVACAVARSMSAHSFENQRRHRRQVQHQRMRLAVAGKFFTEQGMRRGARATSAAAIAIAILRTIRIQQRLPRRGVPLGRHAQAVM